MSVLTSVGILISAMLIMAFLQFIPGVFALLSHHNYGKFSKLKASDLSIFFIIGVETIIILTSLIIYIIISALSPLFFSFKILAWIAASVSLVLSIVFFFCYFRKGEGNRLYISRSLVSKFQKQIDSVKTRSDAFTLGVTTILPEAFFTLPLFFIIISQIDALGSTPLIRAFLVILFAVITILPLLIMHSLHSSQHNLADFIRFRFKNKSFFRWTITILYAILAILFIMEALL